MISLKEQSATLAVEEGLPMTEQGGCTGLLETNCDPIIPSRPNEAESSLYWCRLLSVEWDAAIDEYERKHRNG
jgi:hypothetical protein